MLKDEYFGIFSLLGYNMLRCDLTKSRELELIILMSLMTLLDKSDDGGWKRDPIGKGVQDDVGNYDTNISSNDSNNNNSTIVSPIAYEDPIPKKAQQKKYKVELSNDQKLQFMLEKDVRRSQKQIQFDQKHKPLSAGNSPAHTPNVSPLPTPSASSTNITIGSPRLTRQKSACNLHYYKGVISTANASNVSADSPISPISPVIPANSSTNKSNRLSKLFSSLSNKQTNCSSSSSSTNTSPVDTNHTSIYKSNDIINTSQNNYSDLKYQKKIHRKPLQYDQHQNDQQQHEHSYPYYDHQHSLPIGQSSRLTNEFGHLAINKSHYDNPPSVRTIRWNPEPLTPIQTSAPIVNNSGTNKYNSPQRSSRQPAFTSQQIHHRSNSQDRRRPQVLDEQRRMSASEYSFAYRPQHHPQNYGYMPQSTNKYPNNNRYSASEYYTYQQPQQQYDYYP